jgi:hypothetical protein
VTTDTKVTVSYPVLYHIKIFLRVRKRVSLTRAGRRRRHFWGGNGVTTLNTTFDVTVKKKTTLSIMTLDANADCSNSVHYAECSCSECSYAESGNTEGGSITVPLTSCLTGLDLSVLQIINKNCQLSCSWFRTSQTGGQWLSDTSPFRIPWLNVLILSALTVNVLMLSVLMLSVLMLSVLMLSVVASKNAGNASCNSMPIN